jgi:drug/metabolite transporter (DMT)-like permease
VHTKISDSTAPLIYRARALLIGTTTLWGLSFPLMRGLELAQRANSLGVPDVAIAFADVAFRFGLSIFILLPIVGANLLRVTRREWSQALGLALFAAGGMYLQTLGLAWTDASITAFLTQLFTLIVPIIVAIRDRRFPGVRVIIACAMVLLGVAMLSPGLLSHFILGVGEMVVILGAFFTAAQIVWIERPVYAENRAPVVTVMMFALLTAFSGAGYFAVGGTAEGAARCLGTPAIWTLMLALVLLCTVFNFLIMNAWQRYVSATEAGLIYSIEPVIATVLASFVPGWISRLASIRYPNEMLTWSLFVGGALIVGATVLVATQPRRNPA